MKLPLDPHRNFEKWFAGSVLLLLCAVPCWAATLAVTSTADSGFGSLRDTIASAGSGDTIVFAATLAGQTIHLTSGELSITKNLTIDGSALPIGAKKVVLDAGLNSRVLEITAGNVTLIYLTLTNGSCPPGTSGGGILVDSGAALTANSLTIAGCAANNGSAGGGIYVYGGATLTVAFSTISGCTATNGSAGGGLYNDGTALLQYCTLTGNTSEDGGGIYDFNFGVLTLDDCTLVGNSALTNVSGTGGGIYNYGSQANIANITLNNCTLSGNSAEVGGGIYNPGSSPGQLVLTNTMVADNTALGAPDISGSYSGVNNFIGGDPKLAPLGNYGGPTQTMQPLSGSPVINAGSDSVLRFLTTDQRGYPRLSGAHVDIGALEAQFAPANNPSVLKNVTRSSNEIQFIFTNATNVDFTALTSTNLALPLTNWTVLGNVAEISSGQYQFTDTTATNSTKFYRVVSP